jgi:hypothetical protein
MTASLVAAYRKGAITADHLVVQCLQMVDPKAPGLVLDPLPRELLVRALEFTRLYRSGRMVTNYGVLPAADQVEAAGRWIEENRQRSDQASQASGSDRNGEQPVPPVVDPAEPGPDHPLHQPSGSGVARLG